MSARHTHFTTAPKVALSAILADIKRNKDLPRPVYRGAALTLCLISTAAVISFGVWIAHAIVDHL